MLVDLELQPSRRGPQPFLKSKDPRVSCAILAGLSKAIVKYAHDISQQNLFFLSIRQVQCQEKKFTARKTGSPPTLVKNQQTMINATICYFELF